MKTSAWEWCALVLVTTLLAASLVLLPGCGKPPKPSAPPPAAPATGTAAPEQSLTGLPRPAKTGLQITGVVPLPGELLKDQVVVFFDRAIAVPDTPEWPLTALIHPLTDNEMLRKAVRGNTRVGRNFVALKFAAPLPSALLKLELSPYIQSEDGLGLTDTQRVLRFPTCAFTPTGIVPLENVGAAIGMGLTFSLPPDVKALGSALTVKRPDGTTVPFTIQEPATTPEEGDRPSASQNLVRVVVDGKEPVPLTVTVAAGFVDASGVLTTEKEWQSPYPKNMTFDVRECAWGNIDPSQQTFYINFSSEVLAEDLTKSLTIKDSAGNPVPFVLQSEGRLQSHVIIVHLPNPDNAEIHIAIPGNLPGPSKTMLGTPYSHTLGHTPEPLLITSDWWEHSGRDGLVLHLYFNNSFAATDLQQHLKLTPQVQNLRVTAEGDQGYLIYADWDSEREYQIEVTPGLPYGGGATTSDPLMHQTKTEQGPTYVGFGLEGKCYLPRRTGGSLPVESRNSQEAKISLFRLFPSNIAVAVNAMSDGKGSYEFNNTWSESIVEKPLKIDNKLDRLVTTPLDLDTLFPQDKKGVFGLEARDIKTGNSSCKLVLWTNLGLLAHWKQDELVLFAHDLFSLAPVNGAKVTVYSLKNQTLGQANTDARGIVSFKQFDTALGAPRIAVVEAGDDFTYIELDPREDDATPFSDSMPAYDRKAYDAFLYADRDLYRPAETVHARWLVRTNYGDALANVPLLVSVLKPNGRTLLTQPTTLSALGTGGLDIATQKDYPTGAYTVRLTVPGSETPIGTYAFNLEEFVPNRIKATVALPQGPFAAGTEYALQVNAQHLFGAPAQDRKCEAKLVFRRGAFTSPKWQGFRFDNDSDFIPDAFNVGEQKTDAQGNAAFTFTYNPSPKVTFPMKAVVIGRVFELGGRAIVARAETVMFPSPVALGVSATAAQGGGVEVFAAAINPDQTPANLDKVSITLEKQSWNYYVRRYYSHYEPNFGQTYDAIETKEVSLVDGKGSAKFDVPDWGTFRVRVHSKATQQFSTLFFSKYWGDRIEVTDAARPSLIKVTLDKPAYAAGEDATVRIESPFDGQGIVVVQHEQIQDMIPVTIKDGSGTTTIHVTQEQFPNAWVEATVIHAVQTDRKQVYPFSSFGVAGFAVNDPKRMLTVNFAGLPPEIRPATTTQVNLEVTDATGKPVQGELTVAAVDEGIHAITDYKTPNPYAWLARLRKPDYRRAHYYDKVAYDFAQPTAGGDSELAARVGANDESWVRPVALWSGAVQTDAAGKASVTFDVPEFTGQLRLVAVAADAYAVGAKDAQLFVRRPYMLRTSLPRFLLPGDAVQCRATVFNTTDTPCKARVSWVASGALSEGPGAQDVDVAPHAEATLTAPLTAGDAMGQGEMRWEVVVTGADGTEVERFTEVAPIPVRTPAAYQSAVSTLVIPAGETRTIKNETFVDDSRASTDISVSASPLLQLEPALRNLVYYPYGCIEQTVSRLMPMYLLRKNAVLVNSDLLRQEPVDTLIKVGIGRIFSMQTSDGGLSVWPGGQQSYDYGSVYGLHFLTLLKRDREFDVPAESFTALQEYVRRVAEGQFVEQQSAYEKAYAQLFLRAYALYALALDGDLRSVQQIERFTDPEVPATARYMLAAALLQATGDRTRAMALLANLPDDSMLQDQSEGALWTGPRNKAIQLMMLRQMNGDAKKTMDVAKELVDYLKKYPQGRTTQEGAFVISALAEYLSGMSQDVAKATGTIAANGKEQTIQGAAVFLDKHQGPGASYTITATGPAPLYVTLTQRGVPASGEQTAVSQGMSIQRRIFNADATEFTGTTFKQANTYIIGLKFGIEDGLASNVVVEDMLPAGFELENPRLQADAIPGNAFSPTTTPSFVDIRDDRLVLAFDSLSNDAWYYFIVRAVTPGTYQQPGTRAECMYRPEIQAATAPARVEVQ